MPPGKFEKPRRKGKFPFSQLFTKLRSPNKSTQSLGLMTWTA